MKLEVKKGVSGINLFGESLSYSFTIGEVNYYKYDDIFSMGSVRAMSAWQVYDEMSMRLDYDSMKKYLGAFRFMINSGKVDMYEMIRLHNNLEERINWAYALPDMMYKLASVVYIDENENPLRYDSGYNTNKINAFKSIGNEHDFFFTKPLKSLLPQYDISKSDLKNYWKEKEKILKEQNEHLMNILEKGQSLISEAESIINKSLV